MQCIIFILFFVFICIKLECNASDVHSECVCQNCEECGCFYAFPGKNKMEVPDFLRIEHSLIHGYGIFANQTLEQGLILGPYKGEKIYYTDDADYAWSISPEDGKCGEAWMVDARPLDKSNYLRYINDPFGTGKEANLVPFQITERIFYLVCKRIEKDEELLISYGNPYWENRGYMDNESGEECSDNSSQNCERTFEVSD